MLKKEDTALSSSMKPNAEAALQRWRDAEPLNTESMKLLIDMRELNLLKHATDLVFAAFVRTLKPQQQGALGDLLELVEGEDAFRLF
jgi:hypothetical protein